MLLENVPGFRETYVKDAVTQALADHAFGVKLCEAGDNELWHVRMMANVAPDSRFDAYNV